MPDTEQQQQPQNPRGNIPAQHTREMNAETDFRIQLSTLFIYL